MSTEPQTVAQRYPVVGILVVALIVGGLAAAVTYAATKPTAPHPILTGTAESGTFWKYPMSNPSNEGFPVKGHKVEVYESFVVATSPETGAKHIRPHGFYSELVVT